MAYIMNVGQQIITFFQEEKAKAKELGLKCRMIKGELYREVRKDGFNNG